MPSSPNQPLPAHLRNQLNQMHATILALHKELLDHERARYEQQHGKIPTPGQVLNLVINDPFFAWLRPLTVLITQIDELTSIRKSQDPAQVPAITAQARQLLTPNESGDPFQRDYLRAIQESPNVASAHGQWKTLLQSLDRAN